MPDSVAIAQGALHCGPGHPLKRIAQGLLLSLLRGYKWLISPLLPAACRYVPTCSEYAMEAISRFGIVQGTGRAMGRLLRCHPFVKGGYDPVVHPVSANEKPASAACVVTEGIR
jgi:putative membrane protein insertion efficiency factor